MQPRIFKIWRICIAQYIPFTYKSNAVFSQIQSQKPSVEDPSYKGIPGGFAHCIDSVLHYAQSTN